MAEKKLENALHLSRIHTSKKLSELDCIASRTHHLLSTKAVKGVYAFKAGKDGLDDSLLQNSSGLKLWKKEHIGTNSRLKNFTLQPIDTSKLTEYQKQKPFLGPFLPRYELEKFKKITIQERSSYNLQSLLKHVEDEGNKSCQSNLL